MYQVGTLSNVESVRGRIVECGQFMNIDMVGLLAPPDRRSCPQHTLKVQAHVLAERGRLDDVQQLLRGALSTPGTFLFRKDAQEWLDRLSKKP